MRREEFLQRSTEVIQRWWRVTRAALRDMRVLLQESWSSLLLFTIIVGGGALVFHFFYRIPGTHRRPDLGESLYETLRLLFFSSEWSFPQEWYLRILFFVIPILGLAAVADGVLRFGVALVSKRDRAQKWQVAMASTYQQHVIVCGIGKVGYRVVLELLKFGCDVVAIELNPKGRFVEKAKSLGIPVLIGDARRSTNLIQAGVERADAIVPCTDDELANLDIALDAREIKPVIKVVMRMFDPDLARRIEKGFGIHTAFSTSQLAAPIFATAAMRFNVKHSFYVGETLLNLCEVDVAPGAALAGRTIEQLEAELDLSVVCHQGGECTDLHPDPDLRLSPGDKVLVMASLDALQQVNDLNRPTSGD
jgi:Trk K+ transport system NAD-binding subunit